MYAKITKRNESPYFSVLTPFGRRMQKQMSSDEGSQLVTVLHADLSFNSVKIPGPPGMESWLACWRVYRTILLMLGRVDPATGVRKPIVPVAALEEYVDRIQELVTEFPACWHHIMQAEDGMRSEQFERIHRQWTRARLPMNQPWIGVFFSFAARDNHYWTRFVIPPTQTSIARGGSGKRMPKSVAEDYTFPMQQLRRFQRMKLLQAKALRDMQGRGEERSFARRRPRSAQEMVIMSSNGMPHLGLLVRVVVRESILGSMASSFGVF